MKDMENLTVYTKSAHKKRRVFREEEKKKSK